MQLVPLGGRRGAGRFTLVDEDDFDWVIAKSWPYQYRSPPKSARSRSRPAIGYAGRHGDLLHHAVLVKTGCDLHGKQVDHLNGWGLDNRKANLMLGARGQSARARRRNIHRHDGEFRVVIGTEKIGTYPTREAAEAAYDVAAAERGYVSFKGRATLLQVVIDQLETWVAEGVLKRHIQDAPLIEDRYRLPI